MTLEEIFNSVLDNLDGELRTPILKWKFLIFGKVKSVVKVTKKNEIDVFQDFMLKICEEYEKYNTPQYTYKGHSYILTDKRLGAYVWIETPEWNKKFIDGRWILREQLVMVQKSSLESYMYRQVTQFHYDYLKQCLSSKNGYTKKICGKKNAQIYSSKGEKGTFSKEIDRIVCKPTYQSVSISHPIGEDFVIGDLIRDDRVDTEGDVSLRNLLEIMSENMSSRGYEVAYRINILGEHLTLNNREVMLFSREMDLVKRVLEGKDPLEEKISGVVPVRFGLSNI